VLGFIPAHVVIVQLAVHDEHIVSFGFRRFEKRMLGDGVVHIKINDRAVFVGLFPLDELPVLLGGKVLAFGIFPEHEAGGFLREFLVGEDAVLDEDF
jgi:hypothetical protein